MKLAKLCITIAMLLTLVTARPQRHHRAVEAVRQREASRLVERGHATFPTSGYGTPSIVAAAGKALAIELENNNAAAHALLGGAAFNTGEREQAEKELQRAMTIAPNEAGFHASYARLLAAMGRFG